MLKKTSSILNLALIILGITSTAWASVPAFLGAEGGGAESVGGRGGRIIEVTNLNSDGPGSFRAACEASGPRIVVFRVGGIIDLNGSSINITNPYITIAGQTAPGGGILIKGKNISSGNGPIIIKTHNVVIRFIQVRIGSSSYPSQEGDAISIRGNAGADVTKIIIDHCSLSWGSDENFEIWSQGAYIKKVTFSWNISSECLSGHSKGAIIGSDVSDARNNMEQIDIHHNIFMSNDARNPYVGVKDQTIINNLIYNWGRGAGIMARGGIMVDIIGNICKTGPNSDHDSEPDDIKWHPYDGPSCSQSTYCINGNSSIYLEGNIGDNHNDPDADNWHMIKGWVPAGDFSLPASYRRITPLSTINPRIYPITIQHVNNDNLEDTLLTDAGASKRLDENGNWVSNRNAVDLRLIQEYKDGTGQIPENEDDVGGYPTIAPGTPYTDTDHDGMPDAWETVHGFNPNDPSDGPQDADNDGYTNVEEFLNGTRPGNQSFNFSLSNAGDISVTQGTPVSNIITATLNSGITKPVSFSVSGLPIGATASFSPPSCSPSSSTTLTINIPATIPAGTHTITVIGTGGEVSRSTSFNLTVTNPSADSVNSLNTVSPIAIDGILSEAAWSQAEYVTFSNPSRSENQVKVYTLWDSDYLYIAYNVSDSHLEALNQEYWQDDGAEIYLDTENDKTTSMDPNDYHLLFNINDQRLPIGTNVKTAISPDGYIMEISIPWTLINTIPLPSKTMGLLVANNDRDNGTTAQFDWLDLIETGNYARPNLWGDIVLSDEQAGSGGPPVINSFTATPSSLANPMGQVTFAVDATDPDGDSMNHTINFGDGAANGSGTQAVHTYTEKGNYIAEVKVSDGHGNTVAKSIQITVSNRPPSAPTNVTNL